MSEKRFILTETNYIYDNQDKGICPTLESVVKVLNELAHENKELKHRINDFKHEIHSLKHELKQVVRDTDMMLNNQLKEENYELKKENEQLKKENKELREELNFYKNQCINEDIKYLRENTVWEQIPTKTRTYTKTSIRDDLND